MNKNFSKKFAKWIGRFFGLCLIVGAVLICSIDVNYQILYPGNLVDVSKEVTLIDNDKELNGSVSSVYVMNIVSPTIFEYLVAKCMSSSTIYEMSEEDVQNYDSALESAIGIFDSNTSFNDAYLSAFYTLHKNDSKYQDNPFYKQIVYIYSAQKDIEADMSYTSVVGNMIIGYGDTTDLYPTTEEVQAYLATIQAGQTAILYLENNNGVKTTLHIDRRENNTFGISLLRGFMLTEESSLRQEDVFTQGPSGGAMNSLYMYLMMTDEDLLKGRKISGTGTIGARYNEEGELTTLSYVGPIGGIKQKIFAAYLDNADIFYCPTSNYKECMEAYELYLSLGYHIDNMRIVEVAELDDIIADLRGD